VTWRVGLGFDVHPFSPDPNRRLILGGVPLDGPGLAGHSDADVLTHAVCDALLGAGGLGDLGSLFPDHDPAWEGADSMGLLAHVVSVVDTEWTVGNVDCSVVLEAPRLAPHRAGIEANLSKAVGATVSVKAKRAEGLGTLGRREGIACWAVALIESRE